MEGGKRGTEKEAAEEARGCQESAEEEAAGRLCCNNGERILKAAPRDGGGEAGSRGAWRRVERRREVKEAWARGLQHPDEGCAVMGARGIVVESSPAAADDDLCTALA